MQVAVLQLLDPALAIGDLMVEALDDGKTIHDHLLLLVHQLQLPLQSSLQLLQVGHQRLLTQLILLPTLHQSVLKTHVVLAQHRQLPTHRRRKLFSVRCDPRTVQVHVG